MRIIIIYFLFLFLTSLPIDASDNETKSPSSTSPSHFLSANDSLSRSVAQSIPQRSTRAKRRKIKKDGSSSSTTILDNTESPLATSARVSSASHSSSSTATRSNNTRHNRQSSSAVILSNLVDADPPEAQTTHNLHNRIAQLAAEITTLRGELRNAEDRISALGYQCAVSHVTQIYWYYLCQALIVSHQNQQL